MDFKLIYPMLTHLCTLQNLKNLLPVCRLGERGDVKANPLGHVAQLVLSALAAASKALAAGLTLGMVEVAF